MSRKLCIALAMVVGIGLTAGTVRGAVLADIIVVVDESGSMGGEHAWLPGMINDLDTALGLAGASGRYGLVGYGATSGHGTPGHKHLVGGGDFGTAAQFATAAGGLVTSGGLENGLQAMTFALGNYAFQAGAVKNIILVTDEDSDNTSNANRAAFASLLQTSGALLNAVVNNNFANAGGGAALGRSATHSYTADGGGGFVKLLGGSTGSGFGTTNIDYIVPALNSGGGAWNLNQLRSGGNTATSFTAAFVDLKVEEIITTPGAVPEPGTFAIWGVLSLVGIGVVRRKRKAAAA